MHGVPPDLDLSRLRGEQRAEPEPLVAFENSEPENLWVAPFPLYMDLSLFLRPPKRRRPPLVDA